jgi:hypothetical protein
MDSMLRFKRTRLAGCLAAATTALVVMAPIAHAGDDKSANVQKAEKVETIGKVETEHGNLAPKKPVAPAACADRSFATVFSPWHDKALYTLAGGGDFETQATGWTLAGPASLAVDSSPFLLGAALGVSSLELPAGASAVSPPICVARGFRSFRFVARSVSADQGVLRVQVLYSHGRVKSVGRVRPGAEWAPTRKLSLKQGLFQVHRRASTFVRLRFAASAGTVRLDDVYVDPRFSR